jgi:8-oxo-dGTP diphosphatase
MHCFTATEFVGEPRESAEMATGWLAEDELPYERMWDDSRLWVPPVLAGEYVVMDVAYAGRSKVASYTRLPSAAGLD